MIELTHNTAIIKSKENLERLKKEFEETHCIVLKNLISPSLKPMILNHLDNANYLKKIHHSKKNHIIGEEFILQRKNLLYQLFYLLMNMNSYLDIIRYVTSTPNIKSFYGRVYKLDSSDESFDTWHSDIKQTEGRLVGLSLNLSPEAYRGGHFQIRNQQTKGVYKDVFYEDWGTAHIFRIDKKLEHKVTKVTSEQPRIAYAGWFRSEVDIKDYFK